ncbi:MAG TPA: hypothetical protein PL017_00765 [Tenuifilaceae bacterium]|nr:hypothetical protein [Tenuifilaceae bacterium]HPE18039.1 hypothetical protein [Tenuifilaceae bacterium]HPJ44598.1 hypothetical protein [Tenuifilaceae bacterium]HPQ34450.1 hypothetical protein [Tenuifilaceae bacterium]
MKSKLWILWIAAIALTLAAGYYQKVTGPTYPKKVTVDIGEKEIPIELIRSGDVDSTIQISIPELSYEWSVNLYYRRYPTSDEWSMMPFMINETGAMVAFLPSNQPKAGKLEYYIELSNPITNSNFKVPADEPVIIRFKGTVPAWALIPHIIFIFLAMLLSNLTGALAAFKHPKFRLYGIITFFLMLLGGMILGPVVQKFAFDAFWTGFPLGYDLTDNKTLIAFIFWLIAIIANYKRERPWASIVAAVVTLIIFSIPHSLRGSEFSYETGEVVTGFVKNWGWFRII